MKIIELQNVGKVYNPGKENAFEALKSINLSIEKGEYIAIVGPSGSGKSTLLQILGLLDKASTGVHTIFGQDVSRLSDDALTYLRSQHLGFIFQLFNLLPRVSVLNNVLLPAVYSGQGPDALASAREVLKIVGMEDRQGHTSNQLSGGQQQRAAIARALMNRPDIIFADEPTGNLPQQQSLAIVQELEKLHDQGITVVMITHSAELAQRADRVIEIVDGHIIKDTRKKSRVLNVSSDKSSAASPGFKKLQQGINWRLWGETLRIGLQSLLGNKLRSFLTMLGIIIGVFSVITMMAIGEGAQKSVEYELRRIGGTVFRVSSEHPKIKGTASHQRSLTRLNQKDYEAIREEAKRSDVLKNVAAVVEGEATISYAGYSYSTKVMGVSASFEKMRANTPVLGRFFNDQENSRQERVIVLGKTVYENLFEKGVNPVGLTVKVDNKAYRILGILPPKGTSFGGDIDDIAYVPVETAMKRLFGLLSYRHLYVESETEKTIDQGIDRVSQILRRTHGLPPNVENDFKIKNYGELRQTIDQVSQNFFKLIILIALVSLIVGGIGIMNIMLVSVTERTREIGIRKAIGARKRDILAQFLVESLAISLMGSGIGLAGAFVFCKVLESILEWQIAFNYKGVLVSLLFAMFVGIFFGIYPAKKASDLSPINALRYE